MSERITEPDSESPVKLFKSESRKQRMYQYALLRTPGHTEEGKKLLQILADTIEEHQPTPQVHPGYKDDRIRCDWLVKGRYLGLWIDSDVNGLDIWYTISGTGFPDFYSDDSGEVVTVLKSRLDVLSQDLVEENRIIK